MGKDIAPKYVNGFQDNTLETENWLAGGLSLTVSR
jgi:hypothetical protein